MYSVLSNLNQAIINTKPFPYLIIDNALNADQINSLRETFNYTFKNLTKLNHIEIGLFEYDERFLFLLDNNQAHPAYP